MMIAAHQTFKFFDSDFCIAQRAPEIIAYVLCSCRTSFSFLHLIPLPVLVLIKNKYYRADNEKYQADERRNKRRHGLYFRSADQTAFWFIRIVHHTQLISHRITVVDRTMCGHIFLSSVYISIDFIFYYWI